MILALIKDNIIENVIVADSELVSANYPSHLVMRIDELSIKPGIGWTWDGEKFMAPPVENLEL